MPADVAGPVVPEDRLDAEGWTLAEDRTETLFGMAGATVRGHTRLYEDADLRERIRAATDVDRIWRFFFATRLAFTPSLPPGAAAVVRPTVVAESRRRFADDLRDRGFEDVETGRTETVRVRSGDRARLSEFRARVPPSPSVDSDAEGPVELDVAGLLAVWTTDGEFRLAGGAYPRRGLERFGVDADGHREDLLGLLRSVE
jgi:hypothetical protein